MGIDVKDIEIINNMIASHLKIKLRLKQTCSSSSYSETTPLLTVKSSVSLSDNTGLSYISFNVEYFLFICYVLFGYTKRKTICYKKNPNFFGFLIIIVLHQKYEHRGHPNSHFYMVYKLLFHSNQ